MYIYMNIAIIYVYTYISLYIYADNIKNTNNNVNSIQMAVISGCFYCDQLLLLLSIPRPCIVFWFLV